MNDTKLQFDELKQDLEFLARAASFGAHGFYVSVEMKTSQGAFLRAQTSLRTRWIDKYKQKRARMIDDGWIALERLRARFAEPTSES